ncbi:tyrosine-type recombinase/integrase, partial [Nonomuraea sp. K274]
MGRVKDQWFSGTGPTRKPTKKNGRGKRWLACWMGVNGREQTEAFTKKTEAEAHHKKMEAAQQTTPGFDPKNGAVKVREYAEAKYLPAQVHLRKNSSDTYRTHIRAHIIPLLGDRRMGTLSRSDMKAFVASLRLAPSTTHTVFSVLRAMMQAAVDDGVIPANPCTRVPLPTIEKELVEPLPPSAVVALAAFITPRYRLAVWLGAGLGLREGEALGLTLPRVDFLRKRVQVLKQAQGGKLVELKTKASKRSLPIDDFLLDEINRHIAQHDQGPDKVLITNRCRRIVQRKSFNECWREGVEKAGLEKGTRLLSRPGARCRDCSRSVSPGRSPNPPCRSLGNGLSTISVVRRGS